MRKPDGAFEPVEEATATPNQEATGDFFLEIKEPEEIESIVAEATITVVDRTRIDAVISVDDIFAEVDEDGMLQVLIDLEKGGNTIEVIASIEIGEELVELLIAIYSP